MTVIPPTPEEQVLFLRNIQRLLGEGQFTASYKLALLHAISDLCVIQGDDSGGELVLNVRDVAEKFIDLYWQQSRPFEVGGAQTGIVLLQNKGKQAAIIRKIIKAQEDFGGSLFRLKQTAPHLWNSLKGDVKQVVNTMPLWKLQRVGSERMDFQAAGGKMIAQPICGICRSAAGSGIDLRLRLESGAHECSFA